MRYGFLLIAAAFAATRFTSAAHTGQAIESIDQRDTNENSQLVQDVIQAADSEDENIVIADEDSVPQETNAKHPIIGSSPSQTHNPTEYYKFNVRTKGQFKLMNPGYQSREQTNSSK